MLTYRGGTKAKGGLYWKTAEWELVTIDGHGDDVLPGGKECKYLKLPVVLFIPVAVMLGAAFVIFLPFIGFAMLFAALGTKIAVAMRALWAGVPNHRHVRLRCL
ncbi:MAG: hypothetical protein WA005_19260 [Candidatus Binataceae bacterium]